MMSVRSSINVYQIRDTETGREKTVHRNLLLPVKFLYKDNESTLPSQSHTIDSISDLPDHPGNDTRTAQWVVQSDQSSCPVNDTDSVALSEVKCSLDVQNSISNVDPVTCESSIPTALGSDISQLLDEGLVPEEELGQSSSQFSLTSFSTFTSSQ